jgi:hypothetical protein
VSGLRARIRRARRRRAANEEDDFNQAVAEANRRRQAKVAARAAAEARQPERMPELVAEAALPPTSVETEPAPPKPHRARYPGEPDPNAIPPQDQWWETRCWFRARGLDEPYDDGPREQDELDELIYGSS